MNEYNQRDGRSLSVRSNRRPPGSDSTGTNFLPAPEEPDLGAASPAPSLRAEGASARKGPGMPRVPTALRGGGAYRSQADTTPAPDLPRCSGGREGSGVRAWTRPSPAVQAAARGHDETVAAAAATDTDHHCGRRAQKARLRHTPPAVRGSLWALRPPCLCIGRRCRHSWSALLFIGQGVF